MARALLSEQELDNLLSSIIAEGRRADAEKLLETEHEHYSPVHKDGAGLLPYEKFLLKKYAYGDFELCVHRFLAKDESVTEADLQFKRPSKFPAPFWNRNGRLMGKLMRLLNASYREQGVEVRDDEHGGRQIHFSVLNVSSSKLASTPFEQWNSECSLYDEPYSSGSNTPNRTNIRNDFVILRYRRRKTL
jgi:hypothetical protein